MASGSRLWELIQAHLDAYGVRDAALARRMGIAPQTLNAWKKRGMRALPAQALLAVCAREIGQPYEVVLAAVLTDLGYTRDADDLLAYRSNRLGLSSNTLVSDERSTANP